MSRTKRWNEACAAARKALDAAQAAVNDLNDAMAALAEVQEEYNEWHGNLPDSLQSSPVGEKLEAIIAIDIEGAGSELGSELDAIGSALDECEAADLPRGFGRD